jgi:aspartyl-tRNA(Asn)/glutamyl-tRNA(Gln) amidotransferase subunit A
LDQIGPIAKTVEDAAIIFKTISGQDPLDATSVAAPYGESLTHPDLQKIREFTVGIPDEYFIEGISPEVSRAVESAMEKIKGLGLRLKKISLPHTRYALSTYYIIVPAEVSSNLARFDGIRYGGTMAPTERAKTNLSDLYLKTRGEGFGAEAKRRIILGTYVLSSGYYDAYYEKAQRVRQLIADDFKQAFESVDVILTPVVPTPAFKIGERTADPLTMYLSDIFTIPVNLAGLPGISIPTKKNLAPHELPINFQLIGKKWHEADILGIGQFYEKID